MSDSDSPNTLKLFEKTPIRRVWHKDEWYYSIVDVIAILTDSVKASRYWNTLKSRMKKDGFDENLSQIEKLRLRWSDGRLRETDTANRQTLLRIIQSIPSPKAEPFRIWLAEVGEERFEEIENPQLALERMREIYRARGYNEDWIEQRIKNDVIRNELTDEWKERGVKKGVEYAILTSEIHEGTFELSIQAHKDYKLLPGNTNLRDHMTGVELALISLGEATATMFHRERDSQGFDKLRQDTKDAGSAAGAARKALEERVGHSVVSNENYLPKPAKEENKQLSLFGEDTDESQE